MEAANTMNNNQFSLGKKYWLGIMGALSFFILWYFIALIITNDPRFLPTPWQVFGQFINLISNPFSGYLLQEHLLSSLSRYLVGFFLAIIIGVPLGMLMGWFRIFDYIISPIIDGVRFIAPIAWVPFAALWFGTGFFGPILVIFMGAFPPALINSYRGAKYIEPIYVEAGLMLGLSPFKMITRVLFPATIPSIIAGLRISAGLGWMSLVGAELIVASSGIGYMIVKGQSSINSSIVITGMIAIGLVGFMIDIILRYIHNKIDKRGNVA